MENVGSMLSEALSPYQATLGPLGPKGERMVTLKDAAGAVFLERLFSDVQLADKRQLTDVVDGLRRDVLVAEGRLEPCVVAAMKHVPQQSVSSAAAFAH